MAVVDGVVCRDEKKKRDGRRLGRELKGGGSWMSHPIMRSAKGEWSCRGMRKMFHVERGRPG